MTTQTYANHRHNPVLTGVSFLFLLLAAIALALGWSQGGGGAMSGAGLAALLLSTFVLIAISRGYTTKLQDRIILLEMKLRGERLLSAAQQATLARLSTPQVVALRFASDGELPGLVDRAERERMTADQIKRAITTWVPDLGRT